jgi:hypothetical protein
MDRASRGTVFISCGQWHEAEKQLGKQIVALVEDVTPFRGYFAENQSSLEGLTHGILRELHAAIGLVVVMHSRGLVTGEDGAFDGRGPRASVWIEQEIAIASYRRQILRHDLHVEAFYQKGLRREGIRDFIQLNAVEFSSGADVLSRLRDILPRWSATSSPIELSNKLESLALQAEGQDFFKAASRRASRWLVEVVQTIDEAGRVDLSDDLLKIIRIEREDVGIELLAPRVPAVTRSAVAALRAIVDRLRRRGPD